MRSPMRKSELLELILNGENSGIEFKRDGLRAEQLAKEIVALANFQGGRILIGVEDDGQISGIQRADLERWVMDVVFGRKIHPMILPFYDEVYVDDQTTVAVITVTQGATKPYVVRHHQREEIFIRVGSTSQRASREQQAHIHAMGGLLNTERLPVSGSSLQDLSLERVTDYLSRIVGDSTLPTSEPEWTEHLRHHGFMVKGQQQLATCTIAGLILFGYAPRQLLKRSGIRWMAFEGVDKSYHALDDRILDGPLVALRRGSASRGSVVVENGLIENVVAAMRPFVSGGVAEVDESMRRDRDWLYPLEALRESIVNALAHRDWTRYGDVEIVQYADRLEVLSPGALVNSMTVQKMVAGQRLARNPLIVGVLRDYGYVEAGGMGVRRKVIPLLVKENGTGPDFVATEDYLKVVMRKRCPEAMHTVV